jgi:hypothetical protein
MDAWEKMMREFVKEKHPEFKQDRDGRPIPPDEFPVEYMREYTKSKNPNAVFEIGGHSIDELSEVLDRHFDELRKIPGYRGHGIRKDGIEIFVDKDHGEFPTELEGVPIKITPTDRKGMNLGTSRKG